MAKLRDENALSPTRGIFYVVRGYWQRGILSDRDWAKILAYLRDIECGQHAKCLGCRERELIKSI